MTYDSLFTSPNGHISRGEFLRGALVLLAAVVFFWYFVTGRTGTFCLVVLLYPGCMLHARRLHDMGRSAWLLAVPTVLLLGMFAMKLKYASFGDGVNRALPVIALLVAAATALWSAVGRSDAQANRYGAPAG